MPAHKHAAQMALYAQDAAETAEPWLLWQYKRCGAMPWAGCLCNPSWDYVYDYRRRPKTIRIGEFDVPEPMRSVPLRNTRFYVALTDPWRASSLVDEWEWTDHEGDHVRLRSGVCHLTKEAAALHAKALLSFTRKEA